MALAAIVLVLKPFFFYIYIYTERNNPSKKTCLTLDLYPTTHFPLLVS